MQRNSNTHTAARASASHAFLSVADDELYPLTPACPATRVLAPPLPTPRGLVEVIEEGVLLVLDDELHALTRAERSSPKPRRGGRRPKRR